MRKLVHLLSLGVALSFWGCHNQFKSDIISLTRHYDGQVTRREIINIAKMFAKDGELLDPNGQVVAKGREAIMKVLKSYPNITVIDNTSMTKSISLKGDTAYQKGKFVQWAFVEGKKKVKTEGEFYAQWVKTEAGELYLYRMQTIPKS